MSKELNQKIISEYHNLQCEKIYSEQMLDRHRVKVRVFKLIKFVIMLTAVVFSILALSGVTGNIVATIAMSITLIVEGVDLYEKELKGGIGLEGTFVEIIQTYSIALINLEELSHNISSGSIPYFEGSRVFFDSKRELDDKLTRLKTDKAFQGKPVLKFIEEAKKDAKLLTKQNIKLK